MKATDEKWSIHRVEVENYTGFEIQAQNKQWVGNIHDDGAHGAQERAHLAAAAPEMYRALEMCANGLNTAELLNGDDLLNIQIDRETYRSINEALTKARGEA